MSIIQPHRINRLSRMFIPHTVKIDKVKESEPSSSSPNCESLVKYGLIKAVSPGMFAYLPVGLRVINKLIAIIDNEMGKIGAQKLLLPALTDVNLWKKTKRYDGDKSELFTLEDRSKQQYMLSPTYEEMICTLVSTLGGLGKQLLPLKLYQISNKWRDEMKPRHGFLRSREFLMKDLYTFDLSLEDAKKTYDAICKAYDNIFNSIGIPFVKAIGDTGSIGGIMSHEYYYKHNIGEDHILRCLSCHYAINTAICDATHCPKCKDEFVTENTAEIGHTFLLGTKYTEPLNVSFLVGTKKSPLIMGCFGIGVSRIFAMMVEILSSKEKLRWPKHLAPYTVSVITPKEGSKETPANQYTEKVIDILDRLNIDSVLDDRIHLTIGNRLLFAHAIGFPYVIVIGRTAMKSPPLFEIHDIYNSTNCEVSIEDIHSYFSNGNIEHQLSKNEAIN